MQNRQKKNLNPLFLSDLWFRIWTASKSAAFASASVSTSSAPQLISVYFLSNARLKVLCFQSSQGSEWEMQRRAKSLDGWVLIGRQRSDSQVRTADGFGMI